MKSLRRNIYMFLSGMLLLGSARAEFPNGPITLVVPFPPGAASDAIARVLAQAVGPKLGQTIIVENKAGADGIISAADVARATPDGQRLLFGTNTAFSAAPALKRKLPYDPVKSFAPITEIGRYSFFLFVNSSVGAKSVPELIAVAKKSPGMLNYATGNAGGLVSAFRFNALAGTQMNHVPYRGEPAAMIDMLSDRVQVMFANPSIGLRHVETGAIRALATISSQRSPLLPNVPTMEEVGIKDFNITSWAGLFAPAGTPNATLEKIRTAFIAALQEPNVQRALDKQGFVAKTSDGSQLEQLVKEQVVKYRDTIRAAGIQPE